MGVSCSCQYTPTQAAPSPPALPHSSQTVLSSCHTQLTAIFYQYSQTSHKRTPWGPSIGDHLSCPLRPRSFWFKHQKLRPLAGPDFWSTHRGLVLYFQPIRFARFDNETVNHSVGTSQRSWSLVLTKMIVGSGNKGLWALGTRMPTYEGQWLEHGSHAFYSAF